ncbi:MAG: hypothetical protein JWL65_2933 [Gammaproteobacteria bacterium]|nr:hypothetical protein [Gammaproteobacteria bacterium]
MHIRSNEWKVSRDEYFEQCFLLLWMALLATRCCYLRIPESVTSSRRSALPKIVSRRWFNLKSS